MVDAPCCLSLPACPRVPTNHDGLRTRRTAHFSQHITERMAVRRYRTGVARQFGPARHPERVCIRGRKPLFSEINTPLLFEIDMEVVRVPAHRIALAGRETLE